MGHNPAEKFEDENNDIPNGSRSRGQVPLDFL
jgi:hypothetical protein